MTNGKMKFSIPFYKQIGDESADLLIHLHLSIAIHCFILRLSPIPSPSTTSLALYSDNSVTLTCATKDLLAAPEDQPLYSRYR